MNRPARSTRQAARRHLVVSRNRRQERPAATLMQAQGGGRFGDMHSGASVDSDGERTFSCPAVRSRRERQPAGRGGISNKGGSPTRVSPQHPPDRSRRRCGTARYSGPAGLDELKEHRKPPASLHISSLERSRRVTGVTSQANAREMPHSRGENRPHVVPDHRHDEWPQGWFRSRPRRCSRPAAKNPSPR